MKKPLAIAAAAAIVGLVVGTVVWKSIRHSPAANTVTIGAVLPLSGPAAFLGEGTLNGLRLAEQQANEGQWGPQPFKLRLVAEDGAGVAKTSIGAYQKLVGTDKARIIITTLSGVSMALKPLAEQESVLLFANASHPGITKDAKYTLRHSNVASQEAAAIAGSIREKQLKNGVVIMLEGDDYGIAFADSLEGDLRQASVKVLADIRFEQASLDARVLAQRAIADKPDAVVVLGVGKNLGLIIRRLREYGFTGHIYTGLGFVLIPGAVEAAGEHARGVIHTQFDFDSASPEYKALGEEYRRRFGQDLGATALISYNTLKLLCSAMTPVGEPAAAADRIRTLKEFKGVGERIVISEHGDLMPAIRLTTFEK